MPEKNIENKEVVEGASTEEALENVIKFKRPIEFEGDHYDKITLNFDSLTGEDIEKAEVQFNAQNPQHAAMTMMKDLSKPYLAIVASKAAGINVSVIRKLSAYDYNKVTARTMVFLTRGE